MPCSRVRLQSLIPINAWCWPKGSACPKPGLAQAGCEPDGLCRLGSRHRDPRRLGRPRGAVRHKPDRGIGQFARCAISRSVCQRNHPRRDAGPVMRPGRSPCERGGGDLLGSPYQPLRMARTAGFSFGCLRAGRPRRRYVDIGPPRSDAESATINRSGRRLDGHGASDPDCAVGPGLSASTPCLISPGFSASILSSHSAC